MYLIAQDFYNKWRSECSHCTASLADNWHNKKAYNNLIFAGRDSVIDAIAAQLGLAAYCEYYSLDVVLYSSDDLVPAPPRPIGETWLRRIRIAFEHEHDFGPGLFHEVAHLMLTDCDLRVVVSYPGNAGQRDRELEMLHKLIAGSDRSPEIAQSGSLLFICGALTDEGSVNWEGYVYSTGSWRLLS